MCDTTTKPTSTMIGNEINNSNKQRQEINSKNQHKFLSSDSVDCNVEYDDTLSVTYTSCSDCSNVCNLENNELSFRPNFIKNIETSTAKIGSVCVENSTNVTFGNKTYFNGPVVITHYVGNNVETSRTKKESKKPSQLKKSKNCDYFVKIEIMYRL